MTWIMLPGAKELAAQLEVGQTEGQGIRTAGSSDGDHLVVRDSDDRDGVQLGAPGQAGGGIRASAGGAGPSLQRGAVGPRDDDRVFYPIGPEGTTPDSGIPSIASWAAGPVDQVNFSTPHNGLAASIDINMSFAADGVSTLHSFQNNGAPDLFETANHVYLPTESGVMQLAARKRGVEAGSLKEHREIVTDQDVLRKVRSLVLHGATLEEALRIHHGRVFTRGTEFAEQTGHLVKGIQVDSTPNTPDAPYDSLVVRFHLDRAF